MKNCLRSTAAVALLFLLPARTALAVEACSSNWCVSVTICQGILVWPHGTFWQGYYSNPPNSHGDVGWNIVPIIGCQTNCPTPDHTFTWFTWTDANCLCCDKHNRQTNATVWFQCGSWYSIPLSKPNGYCSYEWQIWSTSCYATPPPCPGQYMLCGYSTGPNCLGGSPMGFSESQLITPKREDEQ